MTLIERVKGKIRKVFKKSKEKKSNEAPGACVSLLPPADDSQVLTDPLEDSSMSISIPESLSSPLLTSAQRTILEQLVRNSSTEQRHLKRVQIILHYAQGYSKSQIARDLQMDRKTVGKWCLRWEEVRELLTQLEVEGICDKAYRAVIVEVLSDASRSGAPITFSAEQVTRIVALACEVLDSSDEGVSHWTHGHLAAEAVVRGIVETISGSSVGRFLGEAELKPHQNRYWLNAPDKHSEAFDQEVRTVCDLYQQAPELEKQGIHVVSTDEKTGIQALERKHATHPAQPGGRQPAERQEHSYDRHDTLCLIGNFKVATGTIISPSLGATRTEKDFLNHIVRTVALAPQGQWIFITDQLNTHQSASLVELVAEQCGIVEDLGKKGVRGILASMKTRKEFLSNPEHRIRFVYTPKHSSWLNQIEIWFSILVRRLLKRGSFSSLEHLKARILKFIDFFNRTMAKAFKWTYRGRPLTV